MPKKKKPTGSPVIGARIIQDREAAGFKTQDALAAEWKRRFKEEISRESISNWERGENMLSRKNALRLSALFNKPVDRYQSERPLSELRGVSQSHRKIPVLNYIQAGTPREVIDSYTPGGGMEALDMDAELAEELGPYSYALVIDGDSMAPEFQPGDRVIIDPDVVPRPGDFVVAKLDGEATATFKKYRPRGRDKAGFETFELVPLNDDYPTRTVDSESPGRVIGTMIEHRRRRRK